MRRIARAALAVVVVLGVGCGVAYHQLTGGLTMNAAATATATLVEYSDGTIMAKIGDEDRTPVQLSQISRNAVWAVVAAEDRGFFSEPGFSIRGTARAAVSNVLGGTSQGGSGLTQQYVKNAYLSDQHSLSRKLKELAVAVKVNAEYSKDQILEDYLNTVYFGRGAYGIEAAAGAYFDEHASDLSVAQSALLAALLRAPTYYDDSNQRAALLQRWRYVLDGLVAAGHLTTVQERSLTFPVSIPPEDAIGVNAHGPTAFLVQRVTAELAAHGLSHIAGSGMVIRTTVDRRIQSAAVAAMNHTLAPADPAAKNAAIAIDPRSGGVLAYYGGVGPQDSGPSDFFDWAGVGCRPGGTAFEPFVVAATLSSERFIGPSPANMDMLEPSADAIANTAHTSGIEPTCGGVRTLNEVKSAELGGSPVHPMDIAVGYATFADRGTARPSHFVQSVSSADGNLLYAYRDSGAAAVSAVVADAVTDAFGQAGPCDDAGIGQTHDGRPITSINMRSGTGKTGATDAWAAGYTSRASVVVWAGVGDSSHALTNGPSWDVLVGQAWQTVMNMAMSTPNVAQALNASTEQGCSDDGGLSPTTNRTEAGQTPAQTDDSVDCLRQRCVALTFDDGPGPYTQQLLDELDTAHVKATFFLIGQNIVQHPDAVRREVADGMAIGNHTWDHQDLDGLTVAQQRDEVARTEQTFHNLTGHTMSFMRPPDGAHNTATSQLGLPIILWDTDTQDWSNRNSAETTRRALAAQSGSVVIMHDIQPSTIAAIPGIIAALRAEGYVLVTIPQMFGHLTAGRQYYRLWDIEH